MNSGFHRESMKINLSEGNPERGPCEWADPAPRQEGPPLARRPLAFSEFFQLRSENEFELELDDPVTLPVGGVAEKLVHRLTFWIGCSVCGRIERQGHVGFRI